MKCPQYEGECPDPEACQTGTPCSFVRTIQQEKDGLPVEPRNPADERVMDAIKDWWLERAKQEMEGAVPKAVEYGSTDLAVIGRAMGRMMGRHTLTHEEATEIGIFFYIQGKLARWEDAILHGRRVSDDTLHDLAVYTKMEQRNRAVGGWPFAPGEE